MNAAFIVSMAVILVSLYAWKMSTLTPSLPKEKPLNPRDHGLQLYYSKWWAGYELSVLRKRGFDADYDQFRIQQHGPPSGSPTFQTTEWNFYYRVTFSGRLGGDDHIISPCLYTLDFIRMERRVWDPVCRASESNWWWDRCSRWVPRNGHTEPCT